MKDECNCDQALDLKPEVENLKAAGELLAKLVGEHHDNRYR